MPGFDSKGPRGAGPASGRGMGKCAGNAPSPETGETAVSRGGGGLGRGERGGQGLGKGLGRRGRGPRLGQNQVRDSGDET